ncbi:hypothetical protein EDD29_2348 [Actinocorallia herbida]|uniref:Alpha/beta hydrolase family protein n=1 Tax=Actinocorallia herbida TaxID=58109 RepID=A0A3N1CU40_9ACTN|nr:alpha/beta hydrolase [Actinocorallia herbida]ROO84819.1 hypothetical protein EDD29_2348 [Actinocorallia herbida]
MTVGAAPVPVRADVGGTPMGGLLATAPDPRAVVVALHGAGTTSAYFDPPGLPHASLLRLGPALGFTVLALDRPGYGASASPAADAATAAGRVDLAFAAIDRILTGLPRGAGLFVAAHSRGCDLGVRLTIDERGRDLLGIALSAVGRVYHPRAQEIYTARESGARTGLGGPGALRELLWGPAHLHPLGQDGGAAIAASIPGYDSGTEAEGWKDAFPSWAERVPVPVHYALGDAELFWESGPAAVAEMGGLFKAAPRVVAVGLPGAAHNIGLGLAARAYHLHVLAFAEECVVAGEAAARAAAH